MKNVSLAEQARLEVSTELIHAYRAADEWQNATQEFMELAALRRDFPESASHDAIELIGIEAQWLGGFAAEDIIKQLLECCRSAQCAPEHRVAAAKLCFIIADNMQEAPIARRAYSLVQGDLAAAADQSLDTIEARLIYETSFGNPNDAESTLNTLITTACAAPPRRQAFSFVLAAHALERLGFVQRVTEVAKEGYRLAALCSCGTAAAAAARKLAWAYLDEGAADQAQHWHDLAWSWVDKAQLSSFSADLYGLKAELLISQHDYSGAADALQKSSNAWRHTVHPRWKLGVLSARCAIWLALGDLQSCEGAIHEYGTLLAPLYCEEGNDTVAARYFQVLLSIGRVDDARAELKKYLVSRSKSAPLYGAALKTFIRDFAKLDRCEPVTIAWQRVEDGLMSPQSHAS
jgi:tetratricopeptide (TPR) repeat protein